jgi:hypothetical protein
MADLTATPIGQTIPPGMSVFPVLDWQIIFGVPLWLFISCFMIFTLAAICVYWFARLGKLASVSGWMESKKNMAQGQVQVWAISRTLNLMIGCMKFEDSILSYNDTSKIGMWHHNCREATIRVGGVPGVVVSEDYDQTRDIISEIALTDNSDEFNSNQDSLQKEENEAYEKRLEMARGKKENPDKVDKPDVIQPINDYADYEDFGRDALQWINPDGLWMKSFNNFSNIRFLKYFPKGCSHMLLGADISLESRFLKSNNNPKGFLEKYALPILAVIVIIIITIAIWMVQF